MQITAGNAQFFQIRTNAEDRLPFRRRLSSFCFPRRTIGSPGAWGDDFPAWMRELEKNLVTRLLLLGRHVLTCPNVCWNSPHVALGISVHYRGKG